MNITLNPIKKFTLSLVLMASLPFASQAQTTAVISPGDGTLAPTGSDTSVGFTFSLSSPEPLDALGIYDNGDGLTVPHEIGIFNSSGTELADATVPVTAAGSGDSTDYVYTSDITKLNGFTGILAANVTYTIGAYVGSDPFRYDSGIPTVASGVTLGFSVYSGTSGFSDPTVHDAGGAVYAGPNFKFGIETTPEPSCYALLGAGLGVLALLTRRKSFTPLI